ncbi:MAG: primosome assembly protein PriA, partial [Actinomycetota bacterium]
REAMGFPPFGALAELSGPGAAELAATVAGGEGVTVLGPRGDDRYLVRAHDAGSLADVLAAAPRPADRVRVAVDPLRA